MNRRIEPLQPEDADAVFALLTQSRLPVDGLAAHLASTLVARDGARVVGSAAIELYPEGALLRSMAVAQDWQGRHIGRDLAMAVLGLAQDRGATAVYLLTTTAEQFFRRFGFERIARTEVPASVQTSVEFQSACPSNATVMRKRL